MFEILFQYPRTVFAKGQFVLLSTWPVWLLPVAILAVAGLLGWAVWRRQESALTGVRGLRSAAIWAFEAALAALLLLLLWQPAISVATLKPQQNVVAVLLDDSRSMSLKEDGQTRLDQATKALNGGMMENLRKRFQVRLYRFSSNLERIEKLDQVTAAGNASRIGENLKQVMADSATLPIGAVVLMSDGADNSGGVDLDTMNEIRRRRIPVHAVGFGREKFAHDLELLDVQIPARSLADSRLSAQVTIRQRGYANSKARLTLKDGSKTLAQREITLKGDGAQQLESVVFNAGTAGVKAFQVSVEPLTNEENQNNNSVTRLVNVESVRPRILYMEGEPRWEFKFIRRAIDEDRILQLTTILRTTQNKIYRQGIATPKEHEEGFPTKVEDLFKYEGIIIGSVEAGYFTAAQQELLRQFVDRRGGGLLFLGGRAALGDGGWQKSALAELLPVSLPDRKPTFHRDPANVELTSAGRDSLLCRLTENPEANLEAWKKLPYLADYQEVGSPKPGAVTLVEALPTSRGKFPLLVTQNYGRGRVGLFATSGSWRWQMLLPVEDKTHESFWQQQLRWLVQDTPGKVLTSTPRQMLADENRVPLRAEVRDSTYLPTADAKVEARIIGPEGISESVEMLPDPLSPGVYVAEWRAEKPGSYVAEVIAKRGEKEDLGRDVVNFKREDGVAENFRAEQNRELLEKLSSETGGRYYSRSDVGKLADEISYSEAGITIREAKDLWSMPIVFLLILALRAGEWMLRRKWGVV